MPLEQYEYVFLQNFKKKAVVLQKQTLLDIKTGSSILGNVSEEGEIEGYKTVVVKMLKKESFIHSADGSRLSAVFLVQELK